MINMLQYLIVAQAWFQVHPLKDDILGNPHLHSPLRLYGDEIALNFDGKKMMVITISPARCQLTSWDCKWLYCVMPMERVIPRATFQPSCQSISWVFKVALLCSHNSGRLKLLPLHRRCLVAVASSLSLVLYTKQY